MKPIRPLHVAVVLWGAGAPALHAQAVNLTQQMNRATDLIEGRQLTAAEAAFSTVLQWTQATDRQLRASALFGRGFARQLRADSAGAGILDSALADYLNARQLDSVGVFASASNNAGLILRDAGRHREALTLFLDAGLARRGKRTPYFYSNAGREYEALGLSDSAAWAYRYAIELDSMYPGPRAALLGLYVRQGNGAELLRFAESWRTSPRYVGIVNDALLAFLATPSPPGKQIPWSWVDEPLVLVVRNNALTGVSPSYFQAAQAPHLALAAEQHPALRDGIEALLDAFHEPVAGARYVESRSAEWWTKRDEWHRGAWSSTLRWLGDWYRQRGDEAVAASYYEAALGYLKSATFERWMDLGAALPLAMIYLHQSDSAGRLDTLERKVDTIVTVLFRGKGLAYSEHDLRQIRYYHMTLGTIAAERKRWNWPVTGVIFQLERMREYTKILKREGVDVTDPPNLVEQLAIAYRETGQPQRSLEVAREARASYQRLEQDDDVQRMDAMIRRLEQPM